MVATEEAARAGVARTREVAEVAGRELASLQRRRGELSATLSKHLSKAGQLEPDLTLLLHKIKQLQEVQSYVQLLIHVHHLRDQIYQTAESATKSAVDYLLQLLTIKTTVSKRSCSNLGEHITQTFEQCLGAVVSHLKERVSGSFEAILWPKLPAASQPLNPPLPDSAALDSFHKSFSLLLLVQLSVEGLGNEPQGQVNGDGGAHEEKAGAYLWGIQLLLAPLVKRFRYHFMSKRPTNNIEKPEWYLMDTREVIRLNCDFLVHHVQPLLDKKNLTYYNAKTELIKGLVEIIKEKTRKDIDAISKNEAIFVHNLNETLDFHKALVNIWDYPGERWIEGLPNAPSVLDVYTDRLDRWLELEEKLATEHLKAMLEPTADPWSLYYSLTALGPSEEAQRESVQLHEMKPTKSANALITTLSSVTERYRMLPRLSHRLRFMHEIQITLLAQYMAKLNETYQDNLIALSRHQFSKVCGLINSLKYCGAVLEDWGEQLFFLQLRQAELAIGDSDDYALADAPSAPPADADVDSSTVFDDVVAHYRRLRREMVENVVGVIVRAFKTHTSAYVARKRIWKSEFETAAGPPAGGDETTSHKLDLSPGICEGLSRLRRDMAELNGHLSQPVFVKVWQQVAKQLNDFIFMQVVSRRHHFHRVGAMQFRHDMNALFLIFRDFTASPQNFFKDVKEAAVVLTLAAEARERMRGLLAPLLATPAADTRVSLLTSRSREDEDEGADEVDDKRARLHHHHGVAAMDDDRAEHFARFGLFKLTPRQIDIVLSLRIDHHGV